MLLLPAQHPSLLHSISKPTLSPWASWGTTENLQDQGWPRDPSMANQKTGIILDTGMASFLRGWWNLVAKHGHVDQAWPMRTLNHCGHKDWVQGLACDLKSTNENSSHFCWKRMCTQKGCSLSHRVPKLKECRPGLLGATKRKQNPQQWGQQKGKQGAGMETERFLRT